MLNIILYIFSFGFLLKIFIPAVFIGFIIYLVSMYTGSDPNSILGFFSKGLNGISNSISNLLNFIKNFF